MTRRCPFRNKLRLPQPPPFAHVSSSFSPMRRGSCSRRAAVVSDARL
jgi:hypothetical protein